MTRTFNGVLIMALMSIFAVGCDDPSAGADKGVPPKSEAELAADKDAKSGDTRTAVFAGGCFWCVEAVFEQLAGVKDAVSGYAGGTKDTANYEAVCTGKTAHAEAVRITYDPSKISYGELLRVFFATHDPTTKDRQGPDFGPQYRSAVFYQDQEQKKVAEDYIKQLNESKVFPKPVVTTLEPLKAGGFYVAEKYHQDYAVCNPQNPYIRANALPKVKKVREKFGAQTKPAEQEAKG
jgi:peptide-methionine (S)-S-oxide reductase